MVARFKSTCPNCGQTIAAGSPIRKDRELGKYVHTACNIVDDFDAEAAAEERYFAMAPGGDLHAEVRGWCD